MRDVLHNRRAAQAPLESPVNASEARALAMRTLSAYHFVGLVERFHVSLVALARVLGVPVAAVLYGDDAKKTNASPHPKLAEEPGALRRYVSDVFPVANRRDTALYDAVNESLDASLDDPGFRRDFADFKARQAKGELPTDPFKDKPKPAAVRAAPKMKKRPWKPGPRSDRQKKPRPEKIPDMPDDDQGDDFVSIYKPSLFSFLSFPVVVFGTLLCCCVASQLSGA